MAKKQVADAPPETVLVEALVPMWAEKDVVPVGTIYRLPPEAAQYLANLGFLRVLPEEASVDVSTEEAG